LGRKPRMARSARLRDPDGACPDPVRRVSDGELPRRRTTRAAPQGPQAAVAPKDLSVAARTGPSNVIELTLSIPARHWRFGSGENGRPPELAPNARDLALSRARHNHGRP